MITQKRLKELLLYDPDAGQFIWLVNKGTAKAGDVVGAYSKQPYLEVHLDGKKYLGHRLIWLYVFGYLPDKLIDHEDGNSRNNKFTNLREASTSQNALNKKLNANNTSGVKGVSFRKDRKKYAVTFIVDGKSKSFGHYEDLELAELVANEARNKYHGQYARHY